MPDNQSASDMFEEQKPETLSILPLFDTVLFPKMVLPLVVMQKKSIQLLEEAMAQNRTIGLLTSQKTYDPNAEPYAGQSKEELHTVGTSALILKMVKNEDSRAQLLVQGLDRFTVKNYVQESPYLRADVEYMEDVVKTDKETEAMVVNISVLFKRVVELTPGLPPELGSMPGSIVEPGILGDMVTSIINSTVQDKQKVLGISDVKKRLKEVTRIISHQMELLELGQKIQTQVKGDIEKSQKEYYLRQQMKAIREELGEKDDSSVEVQEYKTKINDLNLPEDAKKEADRELARLSRMHPSSSEYTVASTYLDWLTGLPWNKRTEDHYDLARARKILEQDHYGLEKPKKRVIEYLAVRKLKPDSKGPILCFSGPPGTGKTSLGRSIAKALGRKFYRISLGGVRDEAEIRGHRRTYVGALPGRIIQGIRRAESNNPVFMLDEIDKLGNDFRGDPSSALLEVLDPEQNFAFSDHYLDVPFDLSNVMFITTANVLDTIPHALRDRMEVLQLSGYSLDEKLKIATRFLVPRQREEHGLDASHISFSKGAIKLIISGYTQEAGLRNLEREIAAICRGVAAKIAEQKVETVSVTIKTVHKYLGPVQIQPEVSAGGATPGVATGLAWTQTGGVVLFVEAIAMKGKGNLVLTGQLGDVMKESATAALSFIKANASKIKIDEDYFSVHDLHIHIPAGAIPKDGPSAGVTMLTAMVSLITDRIVKKDLAMTGEITLRGDVLPVGGIKEKVLAAHRAGIKTLILPKWNKKDMEDIPENVQKDIKFYFIDKMMDVLKEAFAK